MQDSLITSKSIIAKKVTYNFSGRASLRNIWRVPCHMWTGRFKTCDILHIQSMFSAASVNGNISFSSRYVGMYFLGIDGYILTLVRAISWMSLMDTTWRWTLPLNWTFRVIVHSIHCNYSHSVNSSITIYGCDVVVHIICFVMNETSSELVIQVTPIYFRCTSLTKSYFIIRGGRSHFVEVNKKARTTIAITCYSQSQLQRGK